MLDVGFGCLWGDLLSPRKLVVPDNVLSLLSIFPLPLATLVTRWGGYDYWLMWSFLSGFVETLRDVASLSTFSLIPRDRVSAVTWETFC